MQINDYFDVGPTTFNSFISYKNFEKARSISGLNLLSLLFDIVSVEIILNKINFIRTGFPTHLVWYKLDLDYSTKYGI